MKTVAGQRVSENDPAQGGSHHDHPEGEGVALEYRGVGDRVPRSPDQSVKRQSYKSFIRMANWKYTVVLHVPDSSYKLPGS